MFFWFPQPCHADTETAYVHLCQELATHCVWLAPPNSKPQLLCTTDDAAAPLASADDPWPKLMHIIAKSCTSTLKLPVSIDRVAKYMSNHFLPRRPAVCDGAGLFSTADHTASNVSTKPKPLKAVASTFLTYLKSHGLVSHIKSQLQSADGTAPLSEEQGLVLAEIIRQRLAPQSDPGTFHEIAPGQPFRLNVLQCLASALQDKDAALPALISRRRTHGHLRAATLQWSVDTCTARTRLHARLQPRIARALPGQLVGGRNQPGAPGTTGE